MPAHRLLPALLALVTLSLPTLGSEGPPHVRVAEQSARGVTLEVRVATGAVSFREAADGQRQVRIDGAPLVPLAGRPELPVLMATVGVPEGARVHVSYTAADEWPSAGPPVQAVGELDPETREFVRRPDPAVYSAAGPWPADRVGVELVRFRGLRLARLSIYPLRYDPGSREVLLTPALDIQVRFDGGAGYAPAGGALGPVEERLLRRLVNRESFVATRGAARPAAHPEADADPSGRGRRDADGKAPAPGGPGVKIRVAAEGLVRVTRAELAAAGFDAAGADPRNLELSYRGTPIPCRVVGEGDGSFDAGDRVEFFGVPGTGRFSRNNVYWLEEKPGPGLRYATRDASPGGAPAAVTFPQRLRFEEGNSIYDFGEGVQEGDPHFFWAWFDANNPNAPRITRLTHVAPLPGVDPTGPQATLRAFFSGQTDPVEDPDHRVEFSVNGEVIGESSWNGMTFHTAEIDFDPGLLTTGDNTFEIRLLSAAVVDVYYLDWFEVDYPRSTVASADRLAIAGRGDAPTRYDVGGFGSVGDALVLDVTDPLAPVRLTGVEVVSGPSNRLRFEDVPEGRAYFVAGDGGRITAPSLTLDVPSDLRAAGAAADLLIVVPDGWEAALAPLVAHRQSQGLRVKLTHLTDVADEFAGGNVDDLAIRALVRHAYEQWQAPALSYLLLVGEPNLDPQNFLARSPFDHWMPTHFGVTEALGETMTDNWFGAVAGDDLLPDVAVGRLSVRSAAAAADVVAKLIAYETGAADGAAWRENVVRVASTSPLFEQALARATDRLPAHFTVDTEYRLANASTQSIQSSINAGAAVVSFLGHGNVTTWADSPGGSFFTTTHANALNNAGRLPLVTALNCLNGLVGHPTLRDSLAEVLVNHPTRGALAVWSPSGLGFLSEFDALQSLLYETIFQDPVPVIGAAATGALVRTLLEQPVDIDLVTKMIFTGDPSGFLAVDSDDDGVLDFHENANGMDPGDRDSDDDGLLDGLEGDAGVGGAGLANDSDGDGRPDALDPDSDNDGLPDGLEAGVAIADPDTDVSRGRFVADLHPASTTDPRDADSDHGGAPDGIEDRNGNGRVDAGETDPQNAADDPTCSTATPPELARTGAGDLTLIRAGQDTVLTWGTLDDVCTLYRVYVAVDPGPDPEAAFAIEQVTALPTFTDRSPATADILRLYLVAGATLEGGEGPWGHFGR